MQQIIIVSANTGREYTMQVLFARNVKSQLLERVKASVQTYINEDTLTVRIYGVNDIVFENKTYHISERIVQGYTSEMCVETIVKRYKQYITNLFFL